MKFLDKSEKYILILTPHIEIKKYKPYTVIFYFDSSKLSLHTQPKSNPNFIPRRLHMHVLYCIVCLLETVPIYTRFVISLYCIVLYCLSTVIHKVRTSQKTLHKNPKSQFFPETLVTSTYIKLHVNLLTHHTHTSLCNAEKEWRKTRS